MNKIKCGGKGTTGMVRRIAAPTFMDGVASVANLGGGYFDLAWRLKQMDDATSMKLDMEVLKEDAQKAFLTAAG